MPVLIKPPNHKDLLSYLRALYSRTERLLIAEIFKKRRLGQVEYAEQAVLRCVQQILQDMVDETWQYAPEMVERIIQTPKDLAGNRNAEALTSEQTAVVQHLSNNLLGEIMEASATALKTAERVLALARLEPDEFRRAALEATIKGEAAGQGWYKNSTEMYQDLQRNGVTAFVDRRGRRWSLDAYCNMAVRTTAGQAETAAVLTASEHDLYKIVKIGSTCPLCAPLEGRVYSKSGTNPDYPALSLAFGKIDPLGGDDLTNTYLNIHPNCLHAIVPYTTIGKTEQQIQRDRDFSNPEKNPLDHDPRTKKQIEAYRTKERNRQRLLRDLRQHQEYRAALGNEVPKDFAKFRELKYNEGEKWRQLQKEKRTFAEIDRKDWSNEFKEKSKEAFIRFREHGITMSVHALGRLPRLNKRGFPNVTERELISLIKGKPNYLEKLNKIIYYDDVLQMVAVKNTDSGDIVSIVRRKTIKEEWNEI